MASRDYEKTYLGRIANLDWDNPANIFLTRAELDRVSPEDIAKILRQLKQVSNGSEFELVLLEHWASEVSVRYLEDKDKDERKDKTVASLADRLPQHLARARKGDFRLSLALEYENEFPDKYPSMITQLSLVELLLQIMQKENKDRGKGLDRHLHQAVEYKPLLMFFGFRPKFNAQKGYVLVLDSSAGNLADRISRFMHWNQHTIEYLDYGLEIIVNPYEQGFRLPAAPNYALPEISLRSTVMDPRIDEYYGRVERIFSAIKKAFNALDQKFSYDQERCREETRYQSIGLLYENRGEKRLMVLYVSPDKKKIWITGYLSRVIYKKI